MPDNECDTLFLHSSEPTPTLPLRVITQYSNTDGHTMHSPGRPTTLGVCLDSAPHSSEVKNSRARETSSGDNFAHQWTIRPVDNGEFEKLLVQLGNTNSTPVTPTSFLNPRNITEDQEIFADNFSRTLNKLKAEHEGWTPATNEENSTPVTRSSFSTSNTPLPPVCYLTSIPPAPSNVGSRTPLVDVDTIDHECAQSPSSGEPDSIPVPDLSTATTVSLSTESQLTWSSAQLPNCSHDQMTYTTTTTTSDGLPTISTIATSLKEAHNKHCHETTPQNDHTTGNSFNEMQDHYQTTATPVLEDNEDDSIIVSSSYTPQPVTVFVSSPGDHITGPVLLRYASTEPNSRTSTIPSNGCLRENGSIVSTVSIPSTDAAAAVVVTAAPHLTQNMPHPVSTLDLRGTLGDLYSILRPDLTLHSTHNGDNLTAGEATERRTATNSSINLPPTANRLPPVVMTSLSSGGGGVCCMGDDTMEGFTSGKQPPLLNILKRDSPVSSVLTIDDCQSTTTNQNFALDGNPHPLVLRSDSQQIQQQQQINALYPELNGSLTLTPIDVTSSNLTPIDVTSSSSPAPRQITPSSFPRQPLPPPPNSTNTLSFISTLSSTSPTICAIDHHHINNHNGSNNTGETNLLNIQSLRALQSAGFLTDNRLLPHNHPSSATTTSSSDNPSLLVTPQSQQSHSIDYDTTSVDRGLIMPAASVPINPKKPRRASLARKSRDPIPRSTTMSNVSAANMMTTTQSIMCADSTTNSPRTLYSVNHQLAPKRARNGCAMTTTTGSTTLNAGSGIYQPTSVPDPSTLFGTVLPTHSPLVTLHSYSNFAASVAPMFTSNGGNLDAMQLLALPCKTDPYQQHQQLQLQQHSDLMDSASNHSGHSFEQSSGRTPHAGGHNTPSSSLDETGGGCDGGSGGSLVLMNQGGMKLERKRARNRVAARRCRERKLSLIHTLEIQVAERDALVKQLENIVMCYRSEGERLRAHMEQLALSYPNLKSELSHFPFLFQSSLCIQSEEQSHTQLQHHHQQQQQQQLQTKTPSELATGFTTSKHFS